MFSANTQLQVADTNFNAIKESFKQFISQKTEFRDYDFNGSTISQVLDILAYDAYQKGIYTNFAMNENFLDTAQIRSNVVSNAKKLGYVPRSAKSSFAELQITFTPSDNPDAVFIPKYTAFKAKKSNVEYQFLTLQDYVLNASDNYLKIIEIHEGILVRQKFTYNSNQKFYELFNENINEDTIRVNVKGSASATEKVEFFRFTDLTEVSSDTNVFWLEESFNDTYHIYFGDGVLGTELENGNIIEVEYVVCHNSEPNGINVFTPVGYSGQNINNATSRYISSNIQTVTRSNYGREKESVESIKFNAPRYYTIQNRLVTVNDYRAFIMRNYSFIDSLSVWGGEENPTLIPGRVLISAKPKNGYALSETLKNRMISDMKKRNVLSIEPLMVDPTFVYVNPSIRVEYDSKTTTLDADALLHLVAQAVIDFEETQLSVFEKSFVFSRLIKTVDNASQAIIGSEIDILLEKRFVPIFDRTFTYSLNFNTPLFRPYDGYKGAVSSTGFKINTNPNWLYFEDNGLGKIKCYYNSGSTKVYLNGDYGTIDYETGVMELTSMYFTEIENDETEIKVSIQPASKNYNPIRNQIILLSYPRVSLYDRNVMEIVKSDFVDTFGNISPIYNNSTNVPTTL